MAQDFLAGGIGAAARAWPLAGAPRDAAACSVASNIAPFRAAAATAFAEAGTAQGRTHAVAILGTPRWAEPELDRRHREAGAAQAFLAAAERYGPEVFARTQGAFAAAVWSVSDAALTVAVDRAGQVPLYWTQTADGSAAFAHECQAFQDLPGFDARLDSESLYDYLFYYCVPGPRSIYAGVAKLEPGACVTFRDGTATVARYWSMPYVSEGDRTAASWGEDLRGTLDGAVRRSLESCNGHAVGLFLSGGLDSSTINGLAARQTGPARSFTIRFADKAYDEGEYARIAAERFGLDHHERYVEPQEVEGIMDAVAAHCGEPYGNTSAIAAYYCARAARDAGVDVMISGDGGDELFAGNERYVGLRRYDVYGRIPAALRRWLLDPLLARSWAGRLPPAAKAQRLMRRYYMPLPERMFADYDPFQEFPVGEVFHSNLLARVRDHDPVGAARTAFEAPAAGDSLQRMMALDLKLTIADNDLVKVSRMCALAGVGVRYPMLDDEVMALAARIPSDILLPGGRLRGFYKDAFAELLPREIVEKPKHGFGLPFQPWIGANATLRQKVLDSLSDLRGRQILTGRYIAALQDACRPDSDRRLRGNAWDAAMLELWLKSHPAAL